MTNPKNWQSWSPTLKIGWNDQIPEYIHCDSKWGYIFVRQSPDTYCLIVPRYNLYYYIIHKNEKTECTLYPILFQQNDGIHEKNVINGFGLLHGETELIETENDIHFNFNVKLMDLSFASFIVYPDKDNRIFTSKYLLKFIIWCMKMYTSLNIEDNPTQFYSLIFNNLEKDMRINPEIKMLIKLITNKLNAILHELMNRLPIESFQHGLMTYYLKINFQVFYSIIKYNWKLFKIQNIVPNKLYIYPNTIKYIIKTEFSMIAPGCSYHPLIMIILNYILWSYDELLIDTISPVKPWMEATIIKKVWLIRMWGCDRISGIYP